METSPPSQSPQQPKEEKLEFLKREEVRTMAKDIAKIREQQAARERERIAGLAKEAAKPKVVLAQHPEAKPQAPTPSGPAQVPPASKRVPDLPVQARSSTESIRPIASNAPPGIPPNTPPQAKQLPPRAPKLFVRLAVGGIILFVMVNAAAFGAWYFLKQDSGIQPQPPDTQKQAQIPVLPPVPQEPVPPPPPPPAQQGPSQGRPSPVVFFDAPQQELMLATEGELVQQLQELLSGDLAPGFLNLVGKIGEDILSTEQFLKETSMTVPQEIKDKLGDKLMLFSYAAPDKKRLGFAAELKESEGVLELLQSWEQTVEQDTAVFFDMIGRKGSAYTPFFRQSAHQGIPFRFQTFSVIDFGIVYGIVDNKLLLTSSFESFQRAADELRATSDI